MYCQGKLWARRVNEGELGQLLVYDPNTLKYEGSAKIVLNVPSADNQVSCEQTKLVNNLNKYFPLLTDGKGLFAITMNVATKRRKVKDSMRRHY